MKQVERRMQRKCFSNIFWFLSVIVAYIFLGNTSWAGGVDLCDDIKYRALEVVGNGYKGKIHQYMNAPPIHGGFTFKTSAEFEGEPKDTIEGTCANNHLVFIRKRPGAFTQKYTGWLFRKKTESIVYEPNPMQSGKCYKTNQIRREVAGEFSHNGVKTYGWYGRFGAKPPK